MCELGSGDEGRTYANQAVINLLVDGKPKINNTYEDNTVLVKVSRTSGAFHVCVVWCWRAKFSKVGRTREFFISGSKRSSVCYVGHLAFAE
jgi:hypothetical protein